MTEHVGADVCVVGAGYAGLTAARRLSRNGRAVVVLEARDRVGGRIWTEPLADGTPVDRGGAWLAPGHDAIFGLARELGVATYKTWVKGAHLLVGGGRTRRYTGLIPKISPLAVLSIARAQRKVDRLARTLPLDEPWAARRAPSGMRTRSAPTSSAPGCARRSPATSTRPRSRGSSPPTPRTSRSSTCCSSCAATAV